MSTRRGLAIGCGGVLGFAWTAVALDAVERALDWDVRSADVLIGTSAGAEIVAALGSGRTPADLLAALDAEPGADPVLAAHIAVDPGKFPPLPGIGLSNLGLIGAGLRAGSAYSALAGLLPRGRGDASWLRSFGRSLADADGWVDHPATWLVAADAATGQRITFGANRFDADSPHRSTDGSPVDLGDAIAASWAIPGWFPPVRIGGRDYVDGGAVSSVSADLLLPLDLDEVVVIAPMTSAGGAPATGFDRIERLLRAQMTRGLDREVKLLRDNGVRVIRVEPGPAELAAMGPNFMDSRRRPATLAAARANAHARVHEALRTASLAR
ncbi:patatin-like phospholipase family protein [Nocardia ignorata]|uniref:NTE family protein n=1 Tax=Nocardia ignorata TaxID=145285 RepID=A0A4R6PJX4_NOCIG|nr:patatin-like phospholipase family protein [Nocardia ignorata]TDP38427.1 NTE family protein [Nocardia ignorata]